MDEEQNWQFYENGRLIEVGGRKQVGRRKEGGNADRQIGSFFGKFTIMKN